MTRFALIALSLAVACSAPASERGASDTARADSTPPPPPPSASTAPPWAGAPIPRDSVPAVYLTEWRRAENRATCAPFAPTALGASASAISRRANFSGGWAVAYDLPETRSAFGIAGTGSTVSDDTYDGWKDGKEWSDSSYVSWGPEGGTGPNQLAFLRIAGQRCLYNVWSRLGTDHLQLLLSTLRRIDMSQETR